MQVSPTGLTGYGCTGLLHTIIFTRALGPVKPQEEDSEIFDITYVSWWLCPRTWSGPATLAALSRRKRSALQVTCGSTLVQQKIEEGIDRFHTWVDKHTGKRGQVDQALNLKSSVLPHNLKILYDLAGLSSVL